VKKTKEFDCVEMMHRGAERVKLETAGMTVDQQVDYWRRKTDELRQLQSRVRESRKVG
jgi:hypothetical protein